MSERRILRKWQNETKRRTRNARKSRDAKTLQILASRTEEWQADLPEWLAIPAINCDLGNMFKANAAIAIALATWQHLLVIAELAAAGIDEPLGNQARSAKELYVDMEWLHRCDETGVLSARYIDWSQIASAKTSRDSVRGKGMIESIKSRYGSDENWGPDGWARPDPTRKSINQAGRMAQVFNAVRKEIHHDQLGATDLKEFDEELAQLTAIVNAMSHGNATLSLMIHGDPGAAGLAGTFCHLALQSCWEQLLGLTNGINPSEREEAARLRIQEVAMRLQK